MADDQAPVGAMEGSAVAQGQTGDTGDFLKVAFENPVIKKQREDMLRYKEERNQLRLKVAEIEEAKKKAEEERLKEQNEFKTLYEKERLAREALEQSVKQAKIRTAIREAVIKAGSPYVDDANFSLPENVTINADGNVEGAEEFVRKVLAEKPYLLGTQTPQTFGGQPARKHTDLTYADLLKDTKKMSEVMEKQPEVFRALKNEYYNKFKK